MSTVREWDGERGHRHRWTGRQTALAEQLWKSGATQDGIADALAAQHGVVVTRHAVAGLIQRNRHLFAARPAPRPGPPAWADEASAMWKAGRSSADIAEALNVERKTIINLSVKRRDLFPHRTSEQQRALISKAIKQGASL